MADSTTLTIRIDRATKDRLDALAQSTQRSKSYLAAEAIEEFLAVNSWQIAHIKQAIAEADAGGPFAAHSEVESWIDSLDKNGNESPPKADFRRR